MFVDEVDIQVQAGNGGNGCMAFRRETRVPRGGPSGGDGGRGGSIYLVASPHQNTLVTYRFHPEFNARARPARHGVRLHGLRRRGHGARSAARAPSCTTRHGDELIPLADLATVGDRVLVARGGDGGRGNASFATSTNRAPRRTEPGWPGEQRILRLRLKLLADVGLVGFPNAGKSTLISRISDARPKIADYPFTTLSPTSASCASATIASFVVADVPGLIEGAHAGHGLGTKFLAHLERTKVLVHIIDVSSATGRDPVHDFDVISRELELFAGGGDDTAVLLAQKPRIAVANKIDALDEPERLKTAREAPEEAQGSALPHLGRHGRRRAGAARSDVETKSRPNGTRTHEAGVSRRHVRSDSSGPSRRGRSRARAHSGLDRVTFVPAWLPSHRQAPVASAAHRFAMAALAIFGEPVLRPVRPRDGRDVSVVHGELAEQAGRARREPARLVRADRRRCVRRHPRRGSRIPDVLGRCHFAVVSRPGFPVSTAARTAAGTVEAHASGGRRRSGRAIDSPDRCADRAGVGQ